MATCKDCVHDNLCDIKQRYNHPKYALQHIEKYCEHFKDSSRFKEISTPHGRLIDVNKLKSIIGLMTSHPCGCQLETVKDVLWLLDGKVEGEYVVPTIVEAEE